MKISYYFEPIPGMTGTDNIPALIDAHTEAFEHHGWDVVAVNEDVARQHPLYREFDDISSVFATSRNGWGYTRACYMRWLAYAVAGHYFADFDVISYGFTPNDAEDLRREVGGPLLLSGAGAAGLFKAEDYELILNTFLGYKKAPFIEGALEEDVNDMTILIQCLPQVFQTVWENDVRMARDYSCEGWDVAKLVHYPFQYVRPPRIRTILEQRPLAVLKPYQDLIRWLGDETDRLKAQNDILERDCAARLADVTALSEQVGRLNAQIEVIEGDREQRLTDVIVLTAEIKRLRALIST